MSENQKDSNYLSKSNNESEKDNILIKKKKKSKIDMKEDENSIETDIKNKDVQDIVTKWRNKYVSIKTDNVEAKLEGYTEKLDNLQNEKEEIDEIDFSFNEQKNNLITQKSNIDSIKTKIEYIKVPNKIKINFRDYEDIIDTDIKTDIKTDRDITIENKYKSSLELEPLEIHDISSKWRAKQANAARQIWKEEQISSIKKILLVPKKINRKILSIFKLFSNNFKDRFSSIKSKRQEAKEEKKFLLEIEKNIYDDFGNIKYQESNISNEFGQNYDKEDQKKLNLTQEEKNLAVKQIQLNDTDVYKPSLKIDYEKNKSKIIEKVALEYLQTYDEEPKENEIQFNPILVDNTQDTVDYWIHQLFILYNEYKVFKTESQPVYQQKIRKLIVRLLKNLDESSISYNLKNEINELIGLLLN